MGFFAGPRGLRSTLRPGIITQRHHLNHPNLHHHPRILTNFKIPFATRTLATSFRQLTATASTTAASYPSSPQNHSQDAPFPSQSSSSTSSHPPPPPPPNSPRPKSTPLSLLLQTLKLLTLLHLLTTYIIHPGAVEGPSMLPTIPHHGSSVLILSLHRLGRGIQVGDMVCFKNPVAEGDAVKRVVGMEGDYVLWDVPRYGDVGGGELGGQSDGGGEGEEEVMIAGRRRGEGAAAWVTTPATGSTTQQRERNDKIMIQVPKGHVWLSGDNMTASRDSRIYGPVPMALIKGKVVAQWYPWSERQWFVNPITGTTGIVDLFKKLPEVLRF